MHLIGKEWKKVPLLLEKLKKLFEELIDEELDYCKNIAIQERKKCSDRRLSEGKTLTGINTKG